MVHLCLTVPLNVHTIMQAAKSGRRSKASPRSPSAASPTSSDVSHSVSQGSDATSNGCSTAPSSDWQPSDDVRSCSGSLAGISTEDESMEEEGGTSRQKQRKQQDQQHRRSSAQPGAKSIAAGGDQAGRLEVQKLGKESRASCAEAILQQEPVKAASKGTWYPRLRKVRKGCAHWMTQAPASTIFSLALPFCEVLFCGAIGSQKANARVFSSWAMQLTPVASRKGEVVLIVSSKQRSQRLTAKDLWPVSYQPILGLAYVIRHVHVIICVVHCCCLHALYVHTFHICPLFGGFPWALIVLRFPCEGHHGHC